MAAFDCKYCGQSLENSDNSFRVKCPHCEKTQFGCPVCGAPLKGTGGIHSHFAFASPKSKHTSSKEEKFRERIKDWQEEHQPERQKRNEAEIQQQWIEENESEYAHILTEVPVGEGRVSGQPRQIDIVSVPAMVELPGHIGGEKATKGEQWLVDTALSSTDFSTESKLRQIASRHQGETLPVEVYEVKTQMNPKSLGQVLVYSNALPGEYNVQVVRRGVIFGSEYLKDRMCVQVAEEYEIGVSQV